MTQTKKARRWVAALSALVLAGVLALGTLYARGFWDESRAVHINARDIESSTLAIGTHLIHLSALNDSIYEIAQQSAEESGQNGIYYKSELGGDAWFDISSATSLADISTAGAPVPDEEIEALFFTHHTKSDKVTYDLRTGEAVNIFDIRDPYDLESLEELSPLKMQYDQIRELQGENDVTKRIDEIWQTPVSGSDAPEAIAELDKQLSALQAYLQVLTDNNADAREIDKVTGVMEAVDASRRYEVFTVLEPVISDYLDELGEGDTVSITTGEGDEETTVEVAQNNPELTSAVSESLGNVQNALITYGGMMLSEGVTVMSGVEYTFSTSLVAHAEENNHAACDTDVQNLLLLDNIMNDIISDRPRELALLEETLLPEATSAYLTLLGRGESGAYLAEKAKQSAQALLNSLIAENEGEVNTCRGELEFLITAQCNRLDAASGMAFIDERLELTNSSFASAIPSDDFAQTCQASVDAHIQFLTEKRRALELASGGNAMDELVAQKEDLMTQRLSALDNNDLAAAQTLEAQIAAVEEEIRALEAEATASMASVRETIADLEQQLSADPGNTDLTNQLSAAKAELANLEKSLSDGSLGAAVARLKQEALDGLSGDNGAGTENTANAVDALAAMLPTDPNLVLPAMQDIYNALLLNGGDQGLVDTIEQAILENPNALRDELSAETIRQIIQDYLAENGSGTGSGTGSGASGGAGGGTGASGLGGSGTGTGTGTGSGTGTGTGTGSGSGTGSGTGSGSGLLGTGGISRTDAYDAMAAIAALQLYCDETGSRTAEQVLASMAQEQQNLGSPLVFERVQDSTGEYVPLSAIQAITGRRYVWNKNASLGVLAQGSDYYGFRSFSNEVLRDRDGLNTEQMTRAAKYQAGIHIPEEYAYDQFGIQALYLSGTTLGCACDDAALEMAQELFARLLAA